MRFKIIIHSGNSKEGISNYIELPKDCKLHNAQIELTEDPLPNTEPVNDEDIFDLLSFGSISFVREENTPINKFYEMLESYNKKLKKIAKLAERINDLAY